MSIPGNTAKLGITQSNIQTAQSSESQVLHALVSTLLNQLINPLYASQALLLLKSFVGVGKSQYNYAYLFYFFCRLHFSNSKLV